MPKEVDWVWLGYIRNVFKDGCNKCCMSWQGKDMGQLLVQYEGVWPIGTLPIETSPDPFCLIGKGHSRISPGDKCTES